MGFGGFSKTCTIFLRRALAVYGERLNSRQPRLVRAVAGLMDFTELKAMADQIPLHVANTSLLENIFFLEIHS
jgi:hypothetical protein